jgi:pimeloyl-ACP methyl ester carboxylesterase
VLLAHGAQDELTSPDHSRRIHALLACPKELLIVPGVGHGDPLGEDAWERIERAVRAAIDRE